MRSRYDLAQEASVKGEDGTYYKDIFTIPTQDFIATEPGEEYQLSADNIKRPDIMMLEKYRIAELDDIVFWFNNIGFIYDEEPGKQIVLPSLANLEKFYYDKRV